MLNINIQLSPADGDLGEQLAAHVGAFGFAPKGIVGTSLGAPVVTSPIGMSPGATAVSEASVTLAHMAAADTQTEEATPAVEAAPRRGRKPSTPKATPEPTVAEQPAEVTAQDAKDEAAEVATTATAEATIDDLRDALNGFVAKHGIAKAQSDGADIFEKALGKAPAGESMWRLSLVAAAGAELIAKAIAAWKAAT